MSDRDIDVKELARQVVDELEDTRQIGDQLLFSRREAIALSTGAVSLGALGVAGAGTASAQEAAGRVGTESEPIDVEGAQGNFSQGVSVDGPLEADSANVTGTTTTEALEAHGINGVAYQTSQNDLDSACQQAGVGGVVFVTADESKDNFDFLQGQTIIGAGGVLTSSPNVTAADVTLINLKINRDGSSVYVLTLRAPNCLVKGCRISGQRGLAVRDNNCSITNSFFEGDGVRSARIFSSNTYFAGNNVEDGIDDDGTATKPLPLNDFNQIL